MAEEIMSIKVEGLKELNRSLRKLGADAPKGLRLAGNQAAQIVIDAARPKVPIGPGRGGHAVDSLKAASTRTTARVQGGSKRYPYFAWLDFGGAAGKGRKNIRPYTKSGRYVWKAFGEHKEQVTTELISALNKVAASAGLDPK